MCVLEIYCQFIYINSQRDAISCEIWVTCDQRKSIENPHRPKSLWRKHVWFLPVVHIVYVNGPLCGMICVCTGMTKSFPDIYMYRYTYYCKICCVPGFVLVDYFGIQPSPKYITKPTGTDLRFNEIWGSIISTMLSSTMHLVLSCVKCFEYRIKILAWSTPAGCVTGQKSMTTWAFLVASNSNK